MGPRARATALITLLLLAVALAGCTRPASVHETGAPAATDPSGPAPSPTDTDAPAGTGDASDAPGNGPRDAPASNASSSTGSGTGAEDPPPRGNGTATPSGGGNTTREPRANGTQPTAGGTSTRPANDWRVGDFWHYRTDSKTGYAESRTTVLAVEQGFYVTRYEVWRNGGPAHVNETRRIAVANLTWENADNQVYFFPMVAGTEKTFVRGATTSHVRVVSDEDGVTLDVGNFTTHRIEQTVTPPGVAPVTIEYWFADDVRNAVVWQLKDADAFTRLVAYAT